MLGRTHQIRVHMKDRRTPVLGDEVYGNADWNTRYRRSGDQVRRPLLHAYEVRFQHPLLLGEDRVGSNTVITAPIPSDLARMVAKIASAPSAYRYRSRRGGVRDTTVGVDVDSTETGEVGGGEDGESDTPLIDAATGLLSCSTEELLRGKEKEEIGQGGMGRRVSPQRHTPLDSMPLPRDPFDWQAKVSSSDMDE